MEKRVNNYPIGLSHSQECKYNGGLTLARVDESLGIVITKEKIENLKKVHGEHFLEGYMDVFDSNAKQR